MTASAVAWPALGDRYDIRSELGRGSFAIVYRARDLVAGEDVAIKVLRSPSPEAIARFRRELRTARKVTHPGVVRIHDLIEVGDRVALSMELVEGETLEARIARDGALPPEALNQLAVDLARGLSALHRAGVTHRDLKPANIILRASTQRAVIADFGVSRLAASEVVLPLAATIDPMAEPAQSGAIAGTPMYMAPEQLAGNELGATVDVYALGLVLLSAATGGLPSPVEMTLGELREARLRTPPAIPETLPSPLRDVITRCLAIDPKQRFADGVEVRSALAALTPLTTETESNGRPAIGRGSRRVVWLAASAALLAIAATTMAFVLRSPVPAGCSEIYGSTADNRIVFGVALPDVPDARQQLQAMRLAVDEMNQRESVDLRPIAIAACDHANDRTRLVAQVKHLLKTVPAILTGTSGDTMTTAKLAFPSGVLVFAPSATSVELRDVAPANGKRLLWRATPADNVQADAIASVLLRDAAFATAKKIALLYRDNPYGQGLAALVRTRLAGRDVIDVQYPTDGALDAHLEQLEAARPDVTLVIGNTKDLVTRILPAAVKRPRLQRASGHRWFLSENSKPDARELAVMAVRSELEGAYATEPAHGESDAYAAFIARFRSRYGSAPTSAFAAHSYDAVYLLALAAAWAEGAGGKGAVTGERLSEGLARLSSGKRFQLTAEQFTAAKAQLVQGGTIDVEGASGALDLDATTGEPAAPMMLLQLRGDKFEDVRKIEAGR